MTISKTFDGIKELNNYIMEHSIDRSDIYSITSYPMSGEYEIVYDGEDFNEEEDEE